MRELVHVALAGEVVRGRGERAIGALAQRRLDGVVLDLLVGDVVRRGDAGGAGVVVVELPRDERAVLARAASDLDEAGGAQVRPGELLLARPDDLDRLAGGLGQTRRFDRRVAGVLAAVGGAGVGDEDADVLARDAEGRGELLAHGEGALRAGPDRELVAVPFGDRGARLERRVRDVLDGVGLRELDVGGREALLDGARRRAARRVRSRRRRRSS